MNKRIFAFGALALVLSIATAVDVSAQGRGRGGGGGNSGGMGGGRPATAGPPSGIGVDRGLGNASTRSDGRSDDGLGNASTRSNGRSDAGLDRARAGGSNRASAMSDTELNRYRGLSRRLGTTPAEMRSRYEAALAANPNLKYGQFVAANVVADNLNGRYPAITSSAILSGLANGDSLGETLRNLGLSKAQAKDAQRNAEDRIKAATGRN